jgi:glycosyltransferase involved in cell wall biosynthesis
MSGVAPRVLFDGIIYGLQEYGGISRYFTEILTRLGRHCNDIEVLLHLPGRCSAITPKAKWIQNIKDLHFRPRRIFGDSGRVIGKTMARAMRPNVFHSTYYTPPYWSGLKTVVSVHDFVHEQFQSLMPNSRGFVEQKKHIIEYADAIVAVSHATREGILRYTKADKSKIFVIHHGVSDSFLSGQVSETDLQAFRQTENISGPYWLYVGKRGLYKNFGTLLRAFLCLGPRTDGHLVVVGGEPQLEPWQVDTLIKNRLEQRVHLLHALSDNDLQVIYSGASGFVFPALAEGFGIPTLEAMACGAPVLLSDIPVFREVAADAALYFPPYDEEALADCMLQVLEDPVRNKHIAKGHLQAKHYSWDSAAQKMVDIYRSLF